MKTLILTNRVPFPPNSGYPIVVYNTIKGLLNLGVDITLFSINTSKHRIDVDDIYDPVFEKIEFHSFSIDTEVNVWGALLNIFSNQSYNVSRFFDEDAGRLLEDILKENEFDIIQFEGLFVVPYLDTVKANSNAKIIYRAHNIEFDVWERIAMREQFTPRRRYLQFLARRLKHYETEQLNRFHQVFAISEPDRQHILKFGCQAPLDVFPVALDFEKYIIDQTKTSFPTLFHLGAMDWRPNKEGLEWFLDEIWPDIEKLNSELRFYIAGKSMQRQFFEYDSENLVVEGEIFDAIEFINSKAIMIVPLLSSSGMRVKIIEGMAMRKCIIATSMAAEGISYEHGKDILIANTADEFYRSILQCITNPKKWREIGDNARKTVERDHDIHAISKRMLDIYHKLISA
ncbi:MULTISPECIES: glycosyltransferase family 4 protein [Pedobacter]|uniref:Glycosyl transferase group 1 n=1 Tax=Pedobacter heparinus (strain ATCC 13125 / DSM 2366 / CIP 104194 / JCM 7457 / NBRC 12017 / NCIMB 9290 / NRRL B-14731 / HIM 762-3) TaxID=485917 RepID=C6XZT4_PEDHD|nr:MULTISPECIES: glycosyltransferase family 4 protein [Pedobacter]ACU02629.1 glycosyl transferase group 1 [Pedobacter heparinus DSM 2366]MBB5439880.1 glycosyltransferase involved in cell wall biosynthesis [Pedobacter sp. AK017]